MGQNESNGLYQPGEVLHKIKEWQTAGKSEAVIHQKLKDPVNLIRILLFLLLGTLQLSLASGPNSVAFAPTGLIIGLIIIVFFSKKDNKYRFLALILGFAITHIHLHL